MNRFASAAPCSPVGGRSFSFTCSPPVRRALARHEPVVALESAIITHGLPKADRFDMACEFESIVREEGACPATIAVIDGQPRIGLTTDELARLAAEVDGPDLGIHDLAPASGGTGATTALATAMLAARAGIRVLATAVNGWYRNQTAAAELDVLADEGVTVVRADVTSILDVPVAVQRLVTLNASAVKPRTDDRPDVDRRDRGWLVDGWTDGAAQVASTVRGQHGQAVGPTLLVVNPVLASDQLDPAYPDKALAAAVSDVAEEDKDQTITPYLLDYLTRAGADALLQADLAAVRGTIRFAAQVAVAWAGLDADGGLASAIS